MSRKLNLAVVVIIGSLYVCSCMPSRGSNVTSTVYHFLQLYNPFLTDTLVAEIGNELARQNQCATAIRFYTKAIKKNPLESLYYLLRGYCYAEIEESVKALSDIKLALSAPLQNDEEDTLILDETKFMKLADQFFSESKMEEALWCFNKAIEINPLEAEYYKLRAYCYLRMKDLHMAISDLRTAFQMDPNDKRNHVKLAEVLFDAGKHDEARAEISRFDDIQLALVGYRFQFDSEFEEAIKYYTEAIKINPSNESYYTERAYCYSKIENWQMSLMDLEEVLRRDPSNEANRIKFVEILFHAGRHDRATKEITLLNNRQLEMLADNLRYSSKFEGAIHCYTEAINRTPTRAKFYEMRGLCNYKTAKWELAISDFKISIDLGLEPTIFLRRNLCQALINVGRIEEAKSVFRKIEKMEKPSIVERYEDIDLPEWLESTHEVLYGEKN